jgi:septal ring factor EnvC (AmiA/AmiB activator)
MTYQSKKSKRAAKWQSDRLNALKERIDQLEKLLIATPSKAKEWGEMITERNNLIAMLPGQSASKNEIQAWVDGHRYTF